MIKAYSEILSGKNYPVLTINDKQIVIIDQYFVNELTSVCLLTFSYVLEQGVEPIFTLLYDVALEKYQIHDSKVDDDTFHSYITEYAYYKEPLTKIIKERQKEIFDFLRETLG